MRNYKYKQEGNRAALPSSEIHDLKITSILKPTELRTECLVSVVFFPLRIRSSVKPCSSEILEMRIWYTTSTRCCYQISLVRYSTHDWHIAPPPFVLLIMSRKVLIDRVGRFYLDRPVLSFDITFFASLLHRTQPHASINGDSLRTWSALVVMRIEQYRTTQQQILHTSRRNPGIPY